ncbi:MAG: hypothetical protein L6365_01705 [Desulfobulbaceae bacterium]|nr:hypothetical protein [Desulfobulbaceae bacterium]
MIGMLTWQFYIGEHDLTQAIHSRHQCRGIAVVGGIEMKDIPTGHGHRPANSGRGPAMSDRQTGNELAA